MSLTVIIMTDKVPGKRLAEFVRQVADCFGETSSILSPLGESGGAATPLDGSRMGPLGASHTQSSEGKGGSPAPAAPPHQDPETARRKVQDYVEGPEKQPEGGDLEEGSVVVTRGMGPLAPEFETGEE